MVVVTAPVGGNVTASPPGPLSFSFTIGGSNPPAQSVSVSSAQSSAPVDFTVATSASWLTTNAGLYLVATPYTLQIGVNPANLAASATPYSGTVSITPLGGTAVVINVTLTVISVPVVSATPTTMSFTYAAGSANPATQTIQISAGGAAATFSASASSSGWLQVSATCTAAAPCTTPNVGTFNLTVTANPAGLNVGTYNGSIAISGTGQATGTTMVNVTFAVTAVVPSITIVTNGASFVTGPVSPGEIVSIFANAATPIGPSTAVQLNSTTCPNPCTIIPTAMGGVQVMFQPAGVPAPLLYVSATQVTCVVPYEIQQGAVQVQVTYLGQPSNAYLLQYAPTEPGIFTALPNGTGLAAALQYDAKGNYQGQNSSSNPASAGWYITFYVTGEGIVPTPAVDGKVTGSTTVVPLLGPPFVLVDNLPSTVTYFAEAVGMVSGIMQVNAIVPAGVHTGQAVSLSLAMDGTSSQSGVTIYIK
ncbi:MAG: BACON domain-containing protein [Bryobacteraceae bacterium]